MALSVALLLIGLVVLYFGAEYLVKGASSIALTLGMTPLLVGLTVVAFGTSMPEMVVSLLAAFQGKVDIAVGNIVGSNIANIALIVGVASLITPMVVDRSLLRRDYWWMLAFAVGLWAVGYFGDEPRRISRIDGLVLLAPFAVYLGICIRSARQQRAEGSANLEIDAASLPDEVREAVENPTPVWKSALFIVGGVLGLVIGAKLMVDSAIFIAKRYGVSDMVIGVSIVAVGTSLPELATSVVAAFKKEADIALGNIVGSNIFNVGFILGTVGLIHPMNVDAGAWRFDVFVMIGVTLLLLVLMSFGKKISRVSGGVLLASYIGFLWMTFQRMTESQAAEAVRAVSEHVPL